MFPLLFRGLKTGVKSIAAGRTQADLGIQSPHLPNAMVRIGRFGFTTSGLWIAVVWYTAYVNMRTEPGSGPKLVLPGMKVIGAPDRPDHKAPFPTSVSGGGNNGGGAASNSTQFTTPGSSLGRQLIALNPNQLGVPGTAVPGYLWSAPNGKKQTPRFDRGTYTALLHIANIIGRQYGLRITSGYRPQSTGSLHASGLAFDMVGAMSNMKRAATWAAKNPAIFQEVFIHNEGSGMHLHLGFYPDAPRNIGVGSNRLVRPTGTPQSPASVSHSVPGHRH